jgi:hypothetical protein
LRGSCYRNRFGYLEGPTYRQCTICGSLFKRWIGIKGHYCKKCKLDQIRPSDEKRFRLLRAARARAKKFNLDIDLDVDDIVIPNICPILGIPLVINNTVQRDNSPSLDRLDNSRGYVKGNVWVVSQLGNQMKSSANEEQLIEFGKWTKRKYKWKAHK